MAATSRQRDQAPPDTTLNTAPPVTGDSQWILTAVNNAEERLLGRLDRVENTLVGQVKGLDERVRRMEWKVYGFAGAAALLSIIALALFVFFRYYAIVPREVP